MAYRHELKYYINHQDYALLSRRLSLTMDLDRFAGEDGSYFIRSLYFDDYQNSAFVDKMGGASGRDKYRIRIYNMQDDVIKLERKHKADSYVEKKSLTLTKEECEQLLQGQYGCLLARKQKLAREFYAAFVLGHMKPCVLVDYHREAYVYHLEDVRVTFDKDIRTAYRATALFDPTLPTYPAIADYAMVMEVKFNRYLPGYIHTLIQPLENAQRSAISKYCMSRKFE